MSDKLRVPPRPLRLRGKSNLAATLPPDGFTIVDCYGEGVCTPFASAPSYPPVPILFYHFVNQTVSSRSSGLTTPIAPTPFATCV
jgi:hypothetical protein